LLLSINLKNASNVAKRRTDAPVSLIVQALEAHQAGYVFHQAKDEHHLAKSIPPRFIEFPDDGCFPCDEF
jgi:RNA:NAD 2'-phosphotransferase (TPT1/KptA family)